jgi:putative hydrolase of the HAD superfamily
VTNKLPIKLLTFDLDDTLWEFAPVLWRAENITYAWLQQHAPALTARFSLAALRELRLQLARAQPELAHRVTELRIVGLRHAMQRAGIAEAEIETLTQAAFAIFLEARHQVELFDAAEEVLDELGRRYTLAAITNGNVQVKKLGLDRFFTVAINAEQLARPKPHPEPFLAVLQQVGCQPAQCIHIGDDVENDIRGAQRLGLHTVWMNTSAQPWPGGQPPSQEIRELLQLPAAIEKITRDNAEKGQL